MLANIQAMRLLEDGAIAAAICLGLSLLGLAITGMVIVRMPADYFSEHYDRSFWRERHPVVRAIGHVIKNLLGVLVFAAGLVMALPGVPGPGLLVALLGLTLVDFPGKRRVELWLVSRPMVFRGMNGLRHRYHKPPIVLDAQG